jgi:polyphosphate kinase
MPRNLFERCEVVFPVRDAAARARIHDGSCSRMEPMLARTRQSKMGRPSPARIF